MNKNTFIKIFCLIVACLLLVPMVIACGDDETPTPTPTSSTEPPVEKIEIEFDANRGYISDGPDDGIIKIDKGGKVKKSQVPVAERDGYEFLGWSYRRNDPELSMEWVASDKFDDDTTLYAQWEQVGEGDSGNTDNSSGTDNSGGNTDNPDPEVETITIRFNTGVGYFEDGQYRMEIEKNSWLGKDDVRDPICDNLAMKFNGWFMDETLTTKYSPSFEFTEDTTLYASWTEMTSCSDGSYNHKWGQWDTDTLPTCTKAGTQAQYCEKCSAKNTITGDPATGHNWRNWEEGFMRRERYCQRAGCDGAEFQEFKNITGSVLGNTPGSQIEGNSEAFYNVPFINLVNDRWDEGHGEFVGPKGTGSAYVQFNLIEATTIDRIYFKGSGVTLINVFVQYEGESDFVRVGGCGSAATKEDAPFVEPDSSKKIVAIKFVEDNPPNGTSQWQEVAFVSVTTEE